jgi:hypothetical protein
MLLNGRGLIITQRYFQGLPNKIHAARSMASITLRQRLFSGEFWEKVEGKLVF